MKVDVLAEWKNLKSFLCRKETRGKLMLLIAGTLVVIGILLYKDASGGEKYIVDKKGNLIGITRKTNKDFVSYPLKVRAKKGAKAVEESVTVTLNGKVDKEKRIIEKPDPESELTNVVRSTVDKIGDSGKKTVLLPLRVSNDTQLYWERVRNYNSVLLIVIPFMIIFIMYFDIRKKEYDKRVRRDEMIIRSLPGFNDQLLMLLNCGLIFNDAFRTIVGGYRKNKNGDYLGKVLSDVEERSVKSNRNLISILQESADKIGNRWFSRVVSLIADNQKKGVDLREKLRSDGGMIWEERKKKAVEKGKLAESKLSFPLAILLVVLIIVTALPAMLQVENMFRKLKENRGGIMPMEMVQVAILIALAVALGLIFKSEITSFINKTFNTLNSR